MNVWAHRGAFAALRNKMTNAQQMPRWKGAGGGGKGIATLGID